MGDYTNLRPHVIFTPKLFIDGTLWCALYGENIQEGIVGFGDTPQDAIIDFDHDYRAAKAPPQRKATDNPQEE